MRTKKTMSKALSWLLTMAMVISMIPSAVFATDVGSLAELMDAINNAEDGVPTELTLTNDIDLSAPTLPTATVAKIKNDDLTFAMQFAANAVEDEQLAYYGDWYADYVLTVNKDVTFNANGEEDGYLSGQYTAWSENWVDVPFDDSVTLKAGKGLKIMEYAAEALEKDGLKITVDDVYSFVKVFNCGVFFDPEFLKDNSDLEVKLELRIYNPDDENESYQIGEVYTFTAADMSPDLPKATVRELNAAEKGELTFAMNFLANEPTGEQKTYYGSWYADYVLTVNKDVIFNADGTADGYLAGQYDVWNTDWVEVPNSDLPLKAGQSLMIMDYAAEALNKEGLKVTYKDIYNTVKDFDCGVYFTDTFLAANPDLVVTLELRIYNPKDENESYRIGDRYTFRNVTVNPEVTAPQVDITTKDIEVTVGDNVAAEFVENAVVLVKDSVSGNAAVADVDMNLDGNQASLLAAMETLGVDDASTATATVEIKLEAVKVEKSEQEETTAIITSVSYDVTPVLVAGEAKAALTGLTEAITFRLPIPAGMDTNHVKVTHDNEIVAWAAPVQISGDYKFVELSSETFSPWTLEVAEDPVVDPDGDDSDDEVGIDNVATEAELIAALANGGEIKLTADITTTAALTTSGVTATIDLNGKTLTIGAGDNKFKDASNITIKNGNINITGVTVKGNAIFCLDEYEKTLVTTLTLENVNLTGNGYSSAYGVFYIGPSSVLNVNGGEWNLTNDTHASGGVFKADASTAVLNITGLELTAHNVRRVVTYAATTIEDSTMAISGDANGVDTEMEHGFNRSPLTITNSTVTMKDMVGRGITAENGAVVIEKSTVTITNAQEATIDVRNNQTVTVDADSNVTVDEEPTISNGSAISGTVTVVPTAVAEINGVKYTTLAEALTAAQNMTGDVVVEIYDKVTLSTYLGGSYSSIKFVGKDTDAEIYLDVQGYITATGKKVAFEDLTLSKSQGGFINNAGFMNTAFGVYDVTEVTYTGCTFANGAYASSGKVTFTDCRFFTSYDKYGLWAYGDVDATVSGCSFEGARGIKMYAEDKAKTPDLTVKNTDFSKAMGDTNANISAKPAIVLTYGENVTLEGNTYSSNGVFELDLDGNPNGTPVTSDVPPTCVNDNGACGVLVDGKIYTTVAQAAEVATSGSTVTLLHNSTETVELPVGVNLDKNNFEAAGITVAQPAPAYVAFIDTDEDGVKDDSEIGYTTLAAAAAAAQTGDEIILIDDVTLTADLTLPAGIILNGNGKSITGATVWAAGNLTFVGHTKMDVFNAGYNKPVITIGEGACLELTGSGRMVIGHGATFNITGSITDAKTANVADLTPSLIAAGASFTGAGVTFNVTNAYLKFTAYCSSKNSSANGTFDFNVTNSIWEQSNTLVFSEPTSGKDPTIKFNLKDSVLTSTSHLVFAVTKGEIVIDNSNVNVGANRQLENRSTMTIKNGSVVYAAHATSSNAKNPGTTIVENATYIATGEFSGSDVGTGTLTVKKGANVSMGKITKANIVVDATDMAAGELANFTANLSGLAGTLSVINNDKLEAEIVDGKIVLVAKPVAKIGDVEYTTLQAAIDAAVADDTIVLISDIEAVVSPAADKVSATSAFATIAAGKTATIDLNGKTVSVIGDAEALYDTIGILNYGVLTICDSVGTGKLTFAYHGTKESGSSQIHSTILNFGTLTVENGTIENKSTKGYGRYTINNYSWGGNAVVTINGGTISNDTTVAVYSDGYCDNGTNSCKLTISGGTITGVWYNGRTTAGEKSVIVSGGTFNNAGNNGAFNIRSTPDTAVISDGTFNGAVSITEGVKPITGGTFATDVSAYLAEGYELKENTDGTYGVEYDPVNRYINNLAGLKQFRDNVNAGNNYAGMIVHLNADIDLAGEEWTPIGTTTNPFKGTFDGGDHTISNLVVNGNDYVGLFGYADLATISDLTIMNAVVTGKAYVGALAGSVYSSSTVTNCHVTGTVQVTGNYMVGGLVGYGYTEIKNCSVIGAVPVARNAAANYITGEYTAPDREGDNVGGIIGHCGENNVLAGNTVKNVAISGTRKVGGIVGIADQNTDVTSCVVENVVVATNATAEYAAANSKTMSIGGLIGQYQEAKADETYDGTVKNSSVVGVTFQSVNEVTCSVGAIVGGARKAGQSLVAPSNDVIASEVVVENVTGATNDYLMPAPPVVQTLDAEGNVIGSYADFESAVAAACANVNVARIEILSDIVMTSVQNTENYYDIAQQLTIGAPEGEEYTVSNCGIDLRVQGNGASLTVDEAVTIEGLGVVANGFYTIGENMYINGTLKALSLKQWTSNGVITVSETGKVWLGYGDGQFDMAYGNGTVNVNGNGDKTEAQFKAGYSGTRGNGNTLNLNNTYFEAGAWFTVEGSNTTINVNNSLLKVSGGDGAGSMTIKAGNTVNVTAGGVLDCANITVEAGAKLVINGGTLKATNVTNNGTIDITDSNVQITKLDNDNLMYLTGTNTMKVEDATGSSYAIRANDGVVMNNSYIKSTANETFRLLGSATFNGGFECAYLQGSSAGVGGTVTIEEGTTVKATYGVDFGKDYVLNGGTIELSGGNANGALWGFVFQNGNFEINTDINVIGNTGTYAPIHFTDAIATINSSITQTNSGGEPLYIGENSVVTLGTDAVIDTLSVHGAGNLIIDATGKVAGEYANVKCGAAGFTGTLEVINNDDLTAKIENGKIVLDEKPAVAQIGEKKFATLQDAIDAADGKTVTLLTNITLTEGVTVAKGQNVILDLAGKTISTIITEQVTKSFAMITNKGTLTIKDATNNGKISLSYTGNSFGYGIGLYTISNEGGTLNVAGGTIENLTTVSGSMYDAIDNNSTLGDTILNISGGTVSCGEYLGIRQFANSTTHKNTVNVTGGAVIGGNSAIWTQNPSNNQPKANIEISNGEITGRILLGESDAFGVAVSGGTFTVAVPEEYCAEGFQPKANGDGTYGVEVKVEEEGPVPTTNQHDNSYQVGLIEPWFLRINLRIRDEKGANVDNSTFKDYGAYAIRMSLLGDDAEAIISNNAYEEVLNNKNVVTYTMGVEAGLEEADNHAVFKSKTGSWDLLSFRYREGLYTYEISDPIVFFFWYIDEDGLHYSDIRSQNVMTLLEQRKDNATSYAEKERAVYTEMYNLANDIVQYRAQYNSTTEIPNQALYSAKDSNLGVPASDSPYTFLRSMQIGLIEPWFLRINVQVKNSAGAIISYNADVDDYGLVFYHAKDGKVPTDASELISKDTAYVYSKSNGNAFIEDGKNYFSARYRNDIFTYELDSELCYVRYVVKDGKYYYSEVQNTNIKNLAAERSSAVSGYGELEQAVYKDMVNLCEKVTEYRADYLK